MTKRGKRDIVGYMGVIRDMGAIDAAARDVPVTSKRDPMTEKDFEAIAAAIKKGWDMSDRRENSDAWSMLHFVTLRIADACAENNEKFDKARFLRACGM